jgi:hypothetical protein
MECQLNGIDGFQVENGHSQGMNLNKRKGHFNGGEEGEGRNGLFVY